MTLSSFPIWIVDVLGSVLMIVFSFLCLGLAKQLRRKDEDNVIWMYLLWVCYGLTAFAVSRSVGHIIKQILLLTNQQAIWSALRPATGAINSAMFVFVGSVTLFFERTWTIYRQVSRDKQSLQRAHEDVLYLNQNLENLVVERSRELMESETKYRQIFESSQDMILVSDAEGAILELNPAGFRMLGYEVNDPALKQAHFNHFFVRKKQWQALRGTLKSERVVASAEVDLIRGDGQHQRCLLSASVNNGASGGDEAIQFMVKDIEKQRQMREQMAQADKLASLGELSAGVAHEINNPLGIILGYTQLLLRNEDKDSERHADLKTIEKHVRNCKSIVEGLLDFARTSPSEREEVHIHDTLEDVLEFVRHHSNLDNIDISVKYDCNIPNLYLDEKKISQVFINLLMNAIHAVGKSGDIKLATRFDVDRKRVLIDVSDTGYGIDKKNISKIFDPFFTTKPTGEGTGLGLSVSYAIIKNHGGEIVVESEAGRGTTFTVELPLATNHSG
jgi:two-component system, NtrC family, sensor kinase